MSEAMVFSAGFERMLMGVLQERAMAEAPAGLEQRLLARLAQEDCSVAARPFAFAAAVKTRRSAGSFWFAIGAHAAVLLLLFAVASQRMVVVPVQMTQLAVGLVSPPPDVRPARLAIGGGGGHHDVAPAAAGHLPRLAQQQILPPNAPPMLAPRLAVEPSIVVQKDLKMADSALPNMGDPSSSLKGSSFGNGGGAGIGAGNGAGIGPGAGGNTGGGVLRVGGSVLAPKLVLQVDPDFSEEARKAKFSGDVVVGLIVDEHGNPTHVHVQRGVGMGLDEKAVEAVRQYKFKPATQNGSPVKVEVSIDVNFQIF